MLFNARFLAHGILFIAFIFLTFDGILTLKTRLYTSPFDRKRYVEGRKAMCMGIIYVVAGLFCLAAIFLIPVFDRPF
ncbi:hypothetical protein GF337_08225 [candidate division KSB1 bacterium]|nr:hypothetical protein [candidate division KSB1 bacterium]